MSIQYRLEYAGFRAVHGLLRALPHRFAGRLGRAGGRLFYGLSRYRRGLAQENIRRALPELSEASIREVARESFAHHGAMMLEGASLDRLDAVATDQIFEFDGWEHIERLARGGSGFFILSGHFGSVEHAIYGLTRRLGALHLVLKAQANPLVTEKIRQIRARPGHTLIYAKRAGLPMLKALKRGARVCLLIDQRVQPRVGVLLPFLGRPAWTAVMLARLSTYSGCPVVPLYCSPLAGGRFRIEVEPAIVPEGRGVEVERALTQRYNESLEARIRNRPELWYWMHTRWRLTVRHRWPSVVARLHEASGLPPGDSATGFDASRLPPHARAEFSRLRREEFLEACENVTLTGTAGSGKSRTAAALVEILVTAGHPARYSDASALLDHLLTQRQAGSLAEAWHELDQIELLALDDIDRLDSPAQREMLLELARQRHGRRCTLVTCRPAPSAWEPMSSAESSPGDLQTLLGNPGTHLALSPESPA